jgi:hypothetical protein
MRDSSACSPLRAGSLSIGKTCVASRRSLPSAFPAGAPCHNVGTERALHCGGCGPNIVKDGTPPRGCPLSQCWDRASSPLRWVWSQHCERRHPAGGGVDGLPVASTARDPRRSSPGALSVGAPCRNVGTERALHCGGCGPNIVKDGTPQEAVSSAFHSHRRSDTRGALSPACSPWVPGSATETRQEPHCESCSTAHTN